MVTRRFGKFAFKNLTILLFILSDAAAFLLFNLLVSENVTCISQGNCHIHGEIQGETAINNPLEKAIKKCITFISAVCDISIININVRNRNFLFINYRFIGTPQAVLLCTS